MGINKNVKIMQIENSLRIMVTSVATNRITIAITSLYVIRQRKVFLYGPSTSFFIRRIIVQVEFLHAHVIDQVAIVVRQIAFETLEQLVAGLGD